MPRSTGGLAAQQHQQQPERAAQPLHEAHHGHGAEVLGFLGGHTRLTRVSVSYTYSNITGYEQRPARIWDTAYEKDTKRIRVSQHVFGIQKGYMYPEYEPGAVRILPNLYPCVSRLYPRISEDTCIRFCILYVS